jgi:hypothetical protein
MRPRLRFHTIDGLLRAVFRGLSLITLASLAGCPTPSQIREIDRGGKMFKQRADDIKDAVQATDNRLPPEQDPE